MARPYRYTPPGEPQRFLEVMLAAPPTSDCIIWPFARSHNGKGYGRMVWEGRWRNVCHLVLERTAGPRPSSAHMSLHKPGVCRNRGCVNPQHLRWGTAKENTEDARMDGTLGRAKGDRNGRTKIPDDKVGYVLAELARGRLQKDLAQEFGVHPAQVSRLKAGIRVGAT